MPTNSSSKILAPVLIIAMGAFSLGALRYASKNEPAGSALAEGARSSRGYAFVPVTDDQPASNPFPPTPVPSDAVSHVLEYHYVRIGVSQKADPVGYNLSVTPAQLDADIRAMKAAGYTSETMAQYSAGMGGSKAVMMTFDDGYEDFYTSAYPILKKYGWTATVYIISGKVGGQAYMSWAQLRQLKTDGIEIGAHTVDHIDLAQATPAVQHYEIFQSRATIQSETGAPVTAFCYPSGEYTALTENLVKQAGFTSATTENPGGITRSEDQFALNRVRVQPDVTVPLLLSRLQD